MHAFARYVLVGALALPLGAAAAQEQAAPSDAAEAVRLEAESAARRAEADDLAAEAAALTQELSGLRARLIEAARERERLERAAADVEARLAQLSRDEAVLIDAMAADHAGLARTLGARLRLERARPPTITAASGGVVDAARAALVLAHISPGLDRRVRIARADVDALSAVRAEVVAERHALADAQEAYEDSRKIVESLIAEKAAAEARLAGDAARAAEEADALAARARSLRELIAALEARDLGPPTPASAPRSDAPRPRLKPQRRAGAPAWVTPMPESQRFADVRGMLAPPAIGDIVARFGERGSTGDGAGLVIRTRSAAQVSSPFAARVEYAGPFRGYGRLLILNAGDGYHMVVAGLSAVYGAAGQSVLAGEPIGEMPQRDEPPPDLYFEVRKDGDPVDPAPWLRG